MKLSWLHSSLLCFSSGSGRCPLLRPLLHAVDSSLIWPVCQNPKNKHQITVHRRSPPTPRAVSSYQSTSLARERAPVTRQRNCSIRTRRRTPCRTPSAHSGVAMPGTRHRPPHKPLSLSEREDRGSKNAQALVRASNTQASDRESKNAQALVRASNTQASEPARTRRARVEGDPCETGSSPSTFKFMAESPSTCRHHMQLVMQLPAGARRIARRRRTHSSVLSSRRWRGSVCHHGAQRASAPFRAENVTAWEKWWTSVSLSRA